MAASTAVVTAQEIRTVKKYSILWTSHSTAGTIDNTLQDANGNDIIFNGVLGGVTITPGAGGVQPNDDYVMEILNAESVDILAGQGAALDESDTSDLCPMRTSTDGTTPGAVPFIIDGTLTLDGESAGNSKQGTIVLQFS